MRVDTPALRPRSVHPPWEDGCAPRIVCAQEEGLGEEVCKVLEASTGSSWGNVGIWEMI